MEMRRYVDIIPLLSSRPGVVVYSLGIYHLQSRCTSRGCCIVVVLPNPTSSSFGDHGVTLTTFVNHIILCIAEIDYTVIMYLQQLNI